MFLKWHCCKKTFLESLHGTIDVNKACIQCAMSPNFGDTFDAHHNVVCNQSTWCIKTLGRGSPLNASGPRGLELETAGESIRKWCF